MFKRNKRPIVPEGQLEIAAFKGKEVRRVLHDNEWFFSIVDAAEVSVNGTPIRSVGPESVPHIPERCTVVDGNSGEIDVWVTAGYGPVPEGPEIALLARHTPLGRPNVTIQFWAPRAVAEF